MSVARPSRGPAWPAPAGTGGGRVVLRRLRFELVRATILLLVAVTSFLFAALPRLFNSSPTTGDPLHARARSRAGAPGRADTSSSAASQPRRAAIRLQLSTPGRPTRCGRSRRRFVVSLPRTRTFVAGTPLHRTAAPRARIRDASCLRVHQPGVRLARAVRRRAGRPAPSPSGSAAPFRGGSPGCSWRDGCRYEVALSVTHARRSRSRLGDRGLHARHHRFDLEHLPSSATSSRWRSTWPGSSRSTTRKHSSGSATRASADRHHARDLDENNVFAQALISDAGYKTMLAATRPLLLNYDSHYVVAAGGSTRGASGACARLQRDRRAFSGAGPLDARSSLAGARQYRGELAGGDAALGRRDRALRLRARVPRAARRAVVRPAPERDRALADPRRLAAPPARCPGGGVVPDRRAGGAARLGARGRSGGRSREPLSAWLAFAIVAATCCSRCWRSPDGTAPARRARARGRRHGTALGTAARGGGPGRGRRRRSASTCCAGAASAEGHRRRFDPYLAGVPVLLGLACGILALRLYPLPLRRLARVARRGRGLPLHLGLSRAARQPERPRCR